MASEPPMENGKMEAGLSGPCRRGSLSVLIKDVDVMCL